MTRAVVFWGLTVGAIFATAALASTQTAALKPADRISLDTAYGRQETPPPPPAETAPESVSLAETLQTLKAERARRIADGRLRPAPVVALAAIRSSAPRRTRVAASTDDQRCLAEAVYYEARGESLEGRQAVAQVVLNRMNDAGYPGTVCGVVYERLPGARTCQFSFTCDGSMDRPRDARAWRESEAVAREALSGAFASLTTATHYHNDTVRPSWRHAFNKITTLGRHIFYDGRGDRANS